jgi:hypothetical protein
MARKATELKRSGLLTPRERTWAAVRKLRSFSILEVQDATDPLVSLRTCESYVLSLVRSGHLVYVEPAVRSTRGSFAEARFKLVKDSLDPPRVDLAGQPVTQGLARLAMWRAIQVLKTFDHRDVQRAATLPARKGQPGISVAASTAKSYVNQLARAGYFTTVHAAERNQPARYRLLQNTGPHAPLITPRKTVFDRNDGEFKWQESAQEVVDAIAE